MSAYAARGNTNIAIAPSAFANWDSASGSSGGYDNVICVGGTTHGGKSLHEDYKNDSCMVTVGAPGAGGYPGTQTLAGYKTYGTRFFGGTSAATPHVAGVAALLKTHYHEVEPGEIRSILESSADRIWDDPDIFDTLDVDSVSYRGAETHPDYGHGRINAFEALNGWHGTIDSCDTSWQTSNLYASDDRVYIADLTIGANCTLTVAAGIKVRAITTDMVDGTEAGDSNSYPCELVVEGRLVVSGTSGNSVLFSSTNDSLLPAWTGIHVDYTVRNSGPSTSQDLRACYPDTMIWARRDPT
jgi:hypothetical protein